MTWPKSWLLQLGWFFFCLFGMRPHLYVHPQSMAAFGTVTLAQHMVWPTMLGPSYRKFLDLLCDGTPAVCSASHSQGPAKAVQPPD